MEFHNLPTILATTGRTPQLGDEIRIFKGQYKGLIGPVLRILDGYVLVNDEAHKIEVRTELTI